MPGQGYVSVQPMEDLLDRQRRSWQLGATLFVGFGVLALLVAAVGLYGTVSYDVAQRTHELGVRSALGARGVDLVRLVVGQAVRLAGAGVVLGLTLALLASPWIQPLLFKQSARDLRAGGAGAARRRPARQRRGLPRAAPHHPRPPPPRPPAPPPPPRGGGGAPPPPPPRRSLPSGRYPLPSPIGR